MPFTFPTLQSYQYFWSLPLCKPQSQVLPQKTSLKSLSEIHLNAVLECLDFEIFFDSFLGKLFMTAETVPHCNFDLRKPLCKTVSFT